MEIKSVVFRGIETEGFGQRLVTLSNHEDIVTIGFELVTDSIELNGYVEVGKEEYANSVRNLEELVKEKLTKELNYINLK
ncbi:hypothetical protein CHH57_02120 [Niallia circulans]|uniref:Uncharacterized protein n=1 Tax=Niallia circulans TaxID=1397 RepID=A0AA91TVB2_NIACI|nr:hypothetical protein [Niallia circulans]PAD84928.1 hypothetical protein CHH57_02120 [Niallia circulans]